MRDEQSGFTFISQKTVLKTFLSMSHCFKYLKHVLIVIYIPGLDVEVYSAAPPLSVGFVVSL